MAKVKILITGASGYIGGSVLTELLHSQEAPNYVVSALIRNSDQSSKLESLNVKPILFGGLDDIEAIRDTASQHDVVINTASASHDASAKALVEGLAARFRSTGRKVYMIHTSGTSILGDHPYTSKSQADRIWYDEGDSVYEMEKTNPERYSQRVTDVAVVETGLNLGVPTYIVVPPTIYGKGTGPFATLSQQIPNLARFAYKRGRAAVIETGEGIWNHVHIADLSLFYIVLLRAILMKPQPTWLPSGPKALFFAESGEHTWKQVSQGIANAMAKRKLLPDKKVDQVSLKEAADGITNGDQSLVEIVLSSNARSRAVFGKKYLGWLTRRGTEDFFAHFDDEIGAMENEFQK